MTLSSPKAIAFDMDGTLVDSVADLALSANYVRGQYDLSPLSESQVRSYIGDGARKLLERSFRDAAVDVDLVLRQFRAHYLEHCLDRTQCYPGVIETLRALGPLPMAVVTNKPEPMARRIADGLGLAEFLPVVIGARSGVPVKPEPDLLALALDLLGVVPEDAWMVGDSPNDIRVARALGCGAVGVTYGIGDPGVLAAEQPDALLAEFAELRLLLDARRG